jgi:hypothetical protein
MSLDFALSIAKNALRFISEGGCGLKIQFQVFLMAFKCSFQSLYCSSGRNALMPFICAVTRLMNFAPAGSL